MIKCKPTLLSLLILLSTPSIAGVNDDLSRFFDELDYSTNTTSSSAYKSQSANHYSGGSAYIRTPITQAQLTAVTLPSISAGCGGIDLYSGGFSHINSDELVKMGKNIVSSAIPFAVDLALQTWAPQIKNIKDRLEQIAKEINALSINSCEAAQVGVSALAGFANKGNKQYICASMATQNNSFADWASAKNGCSDEGQINRQLSNASRDNAIKNLIQANRNIIWHSILSNDFLSRDPELAEFFMSLSGTVIYDGNLTAHRKPSLLTGNNNLVKVMLEGGTVKMYRCDDRGKEKCLSPSLRDFTFHPHNTFKTNIIKTLNDIITQYRADAPLTNEQQAFLEAVSLPVLKMMATSMNSGIAPPTSAYASVIASDLITDYLMQSLAIIKASMKSNGNDPKDLDSLYAAIDEASKTLSESRMHALQTLEAEQAIIRSMMDIEKRIEGSFSSQTRANLLFDGNE
ncbi:conjugal transfer protein TraH [Aliivibrio fischeri]|uniref:Conjugal transfer pilus assembly protein TraH n=1 Tax=Aliivibrio fischeri TaxID=668 RepID=A0A510UMN0_ALIFS|nr:conjugal transfer protein TraH [Aliivibrio fischeri]GEK15908.1 conjugal transfer pilus assembly protein TraH [Aliivibrio fischeri]